ncbi:hypothetical protein Tco_0535685 [Tanacetum coccineum]
MWFFSQFLPPAFRFEITSPRLACVLVLLVTLFWYEILMPQLSAWRARRNARIMERMRVEAIELHKLRKNAIRRCRNCRNPYRDQNPSGGKFKCSYCGHTSKRPDMGSHEFTDLGRLSNSGMILDLVGKVWSDNNWVCGQDWLENGGNWANGSFSGKRKKDSCGFVSSANVHFVYSLLVFICKSLAAIFLGIMWLFRKVFRISFNEDDTLQDPDISGITKKGETRTEKARRKAEEKKQARLEREQLEEEERKQREEVARLVEERRKVRDGINKHNKIDKTSPRVKNDKKEAEKKRQEQKKERDRRSSRSISDVDELEKRAGKEFEKNRTRETDNREPRKAKVVMGINSNQGSVGAGYLDHMRGNFFPSSKTLSQGGFPSKSTNANAANTKELRSGASVDHTRNRDFAQSERAYVKQNKHADDQNQNRTAIFESQPCPPPKRSWKQLFSRSSATPSSISTNVVSRPNENSQIESPSPMACNYSTQGFVSPITHGVPYPSASYSYGNSTSNTTGLQLSTNLYELLPEEHDTFEDPCYVPSPSNLHGPVSESLDNFHTDFCFSADIGLTKPSPIESPISWLRTSDEKHAGSANLPSEDLGTVNDKGWQMWNSSPFGQDTLGLVVGSPNWYLPQELTGLKTEGVVPLRPQTTLVTSDDPWALRTSYASLSSNNHFSLEGTNKTLVYGNHNGSLFGHRYWLSHGSVVTKSCSFAIAAAKYKENAAAPISGEVLGTTSAMMPSHVGGLDSNQMCSHLSFE